jgi:hypothetical protein
MEAVREMVPAKIETNIEAVRQRYDHLKIGRAGLQDDHSKMS